METPRNCNRFAIPTVSNISPGGGGPGGYWADPGRVSNISSQAGGQGSKGILGGAPTPPGHRRKDHHGHTGGTTCSKVSGPFCKEKKFLVGRHKHVCCCKFSHRHHDYPNVQTNKAIHSYHHRHRVCTCPTGFSDQGSIGSRLNLWRLVRHLLPSTSHRS